MFRGWVVYLLSGFLGVYGVALKAQEAISKIQFNDGANGAVITLGEGIAGASTVVDGVLSISVVDADFRVKCSSSTATVAMGEVCVIYAGGGDTPDLDVDGDGIFDTEDQCDNTPQAELTLVDTSGPNVGCGPSERDTDFDGYNDDIDLCDNTPSGEIGSVDSNGCGLSEQNSTTGYCASTPQGVACSATVNFDYIYTEKKIDLAISRQTARAIPFTVEPRATSVGYIYVKNNGSILTGYRARVWFSELPGGSPIDAQGCETFSVDPNAFTVFWNQTGSDQGSCFLGQLERLVYVNVGMVDGSGDLVYPETYYANVTSGIRRQ